MQALKVVIDALVALGTIAVAVLAVWGDWFRSVLAPAKLTLRPHNFEGDRVTVNNVVRLYYHLKVVNERRWLPAPGCRVVLARLTRRGPDGQFRPVPMAVPLQLVWSPSGFTPPTITVLKEHILDFGFIPKDSGVFVPTLYSYLESFDGFVRKNEAVRFHFEISATNFVSDRYHVFEVAWDGIWSDERAEMARHLVIREIHSET